MTWQELTWQELRTRYGVGVVARGCVLRGTVSYRDDDHWHLAPNVRLCDDAGEDAAVFLLAAAQGLVVHVGDAMCVYAPRLHWFADRQEGVRVTGAGDVAVTRRDAPLTRAQRLQFASLMHSKGNTWVTLSAWQNASDNYRSALQLLQGSAVCAAADEDERDADAAAAAAQAKLPSSSTATTRQRVCALRAVLLSNLCHCQLQQREWRAAIDAGHAALAALHDADAATATTTQAARAKVHYRLAVAHEQLREHADALRCATAARALAPQDVAVTTLHARVQRAVADDGVGLRELLLRQRQRRQRRLTTSTCTADDSDTTTTTADAATAATASRRMHGMYARFGHDDHAYMFSSSGSTRARVKCGDVVDVSAWTRHATATGATTTTRVTASDEAAYTGHACRACALYTVRAAAASTRATTMTIVDRTSAPTPCAWSATTRQYLREQVRCKTYVWLQCTSSSSLPSWLALHCMHTTTKATLPRRGSSDDDDDDDDDDNKVASTRRQLTRRCRRAALCATAPVCIAVSAHDLRARPSRWLWWRLVDLVCCALCGCCALLLRWCHDSAAACCCCACCTWLRRARAHRAAVTARLPCDEDVCAAYEPLLQPLLRHVLADARNYPVVVAGDDDAVVAAVWCALLSALCIAYDVTRLAHTLQLPVADMQSYAAAHDECAALQRLRKTAAQGATQLLHVT